MSLAIDLSLLAVVLICVAVGAKKGLVRTVLELVAFAAAVLLAVQLCTPMATACYDNLLSARVESKIEEQLDTAEAATAVKKASAVLDSLPKFMKPYAEGSDTAALAEKIADGGYSGAEAARLLNENIAKPVGEAVLRAVLFLLLFAVLGGVFDWLAKVVSKLFKVPIVKTVNAALGGALGALKGCAFAAVAALLLLAAAPYADAAYREALRASHIVSFVGSLPIAELF